VFVKYNQVNTGGLLGEMISANYTRMESPIYDDRQVFQNKGYSWEGDFEGRTILALVCLWKATNREPKFLKNIIRELEIKTEGNFYFGPEPDDNPTSEQQVAGNSWYLRGLCELYQFIPDNKILEIINFALENFYYKLESRFGNYPSEKYITEIEKVGELRSGSNSDWVLSTDTGCVFIAIDGLVSAYEIIKDERLKKIITILVDKFLSIDVIENSFQLHATLTATRAVLKMYEITGESKYLSGAVRRYNEYVEHGMTYTYSNYAWYNKPVWTEPCAIVDSIILSFNLYKITQEIKYVNIGNKIFYNALLFSQRNNGGFGCDSCPTDDNPDLNADSEIYEAYWCCTMRASEGLSCLSSYQYLINDNIIEPLLFNSNKLKLEDGFMMDLNSDLYVGKTASFSGINKSEKSYIIKIRKLFSNTKVNITGIDYNEFDEWIEIILDSNISFSFVIEFDFIIEKTKISERNSIFQYGPFVLCEMNDTLNELILDNYFNVKNHKISKIPLGLGISKEKLNNLSFKIVFDAHE